jgi:transposase-like protein
MGPIAPMPANSVERKRLSPEGHARVIHLLFVEHLSVDIVARRFGLGASTIRRIRTEYYRSIDCRKAADGYGR